MSDFGDLFGALVEGVSGLFGERAAEGVVDAVSGDGAAPDASVVYERVLTGAPKALGVNDR